MCAWIVVCVGIESMVWGCSDYSQFSSWQWPGDEAMTLLLCCAKSTLDYHGDAVIILDGLSYIL